MAILISIFVFLIPWIIIPIPGIPNQLRLPKAFFLDFLCLGIICWAICYGMKFTYRNKYLSWLSLWIFITMIFNWYAPIVLTNGQPQFNVWCIDSYIHYILVVIASVISLSYLEKKDYILISKFICWSAVIVTLFAICQITGFDPLKKLVVYKQNETNHFSALIDHPDMIGNYLALSVPFFFMFNKFKYKIGALIVILGTILSKSSISIGTLFVITALYVFLRFRNKYIHIGILVSILLFSLFIFYSPKFNKLSSGFNGRIAAWGEVIKHIKDNPLFGQGAGVTKMFNIGFGGGAPSNSVVTTFIFAHNDYLEMIVQFGVLGLFLFILIILNSIKNFNFSKDNHIGFSFLCSFIGFLLIMVGSFPMETAPVALTGLFSWWGTEKIN